MQCYVHNFSPIEKSCADLGEIYYGGLKFSDLKFNSLELQGSHRYLAGDSVKILRRVECVAMIGLCSARALALSQPTNAPTLASCLLSLRENAVQAAAPCADRQDIGNGGGACAYFFLAGFGLLSSDESPE